VVSQLRQAFFRLGKEHEISTAKEIYLDHKTQSLNHGCGKNIGVTNSATVHGTDRTSSLL